MFLGFWCKRILNLNNCFSFIRCGKIMCLSLLRNKFYMIGLLIYLIPPLAFWGFVFAEVASKPNLYWGFDIFFIGVLFGFIISLIAYPLFLLTFHLWTWSLWLALYYAIAYGFLYLYWRRCKHGNERRSH